MCMTRKSSAQLSDGLTSPAFGGIAGALPQYLAPTCASALKANEASKRSSPAAFGFALNVPAANSLQPWTSATKIAPHAAFVGEGNRRRALSAQPRGADDSNAQQHGLDGSDAARQGRSTYVSKPVCTFEACPVQVTVAGILMCTCSETLTLHSSGFP